MNDSYMDALQQYEGETVSVRRGRGAWVCERTDGIRLLKEYRGTVKRLEFEECILNRLKELGTASVDQYVRNQEGNLLSTAPDGTKYVLKEWFTDRECSLKDNREILTAVSRIAGLHRALRQIPWQEEWDSGSMTAPELSSEMERHSREMKRARTYIRGKRKKSDFELCVMQHFEAYYEQARDAQEGLKRLEGRQSQNRLFLCHGDLDQHHVLIGAGDVAFIEFNQMHRGNQMADLYRFMRKVMEKHGWDQGLGLSMLESYDRVLPAGREDRDCLYCLFLYPEKYWKQLNYYFNANKAWIPDKNTEKLRSLDEQEDSRRRFLEVIR
ncbi:MAG: spore coat protein CotS [Eubacteriales bacterium]|nr:spore coat protein CotS [Eubacteriales bacterium]